MICCFTEDQFDAAMSIMGSTEDGSDIPDDILAVSGALMAAGILRSAARALEVDPSDLANHALDCVPELSVDEET